jgi:hypothetical protein
LVVRTQEPVREALDEKEAQRIAAALLGVPSGERPNWEKTPIPRTFNTPGPEEWPVANRYSLIRDRSTYAENLTQVQQALARLLLNQAEATAGCLPAPSARAEESHMVRVRALAMSRLGAAVTAAALVGLLVALDLEAPLLGAVAWAADHWEAGGEVWGNISERFGASLVLTAAGLGAFAVVFGVMSSAWVSWHQRESLRLCADPDGSRVRLGFSGFLFGAVYLLALILSFLWLWLTAYGETIPLAVWLAFLLVPAYLLWGLLWPVSGLRPRRLPARD